MIEWEIPSSERLIHEHNVKASLTSSTLVDTE